MATEVEQLKSIRENLLAELKRETEDRLADQAAGRGVKTDYSANGRSVTWSVYLQTMMDMIERLNVKIAALETYELPMQGYSG